MPNNNEEVFTIPLSRGYVARLSEIDRDLTEMLDPKDATRVKRINYSAVSNGYSIYAVRSVPGNNKVKIYLAREIMARKLERALTKDDIVQFIDHTVIDGILDYTRDNLKLKDPNKSKGRR